MLVMMLVVRDSKLVIFVESGLSLRESGFLFRVSIQARYQSRYGASFHTDKPASFSLSSSL